MAKKPGGTFFGNLLRLGAQAGQKALGIKPVIGIGAHMIPLPAEDQAKVDQLATNKEAIDKVVVPPVEAASTTASTLPSFDLGKLIKLPTIETNNSLDTGTLIKIGIAALIGVVIIKKL